MAGIVRQRWRGQPVKGGVELITTDNKKGAIGAKPQRPRVLKAITDLPRVRIK